MTDQELLIVICYRGYFVFRSSLVIGKELVNVVYHQQGRDVFVMAAPALRSVTPLLQWIVFVMAAPALRSVIPLLQWNVS